MNYFRKQPLSCSQNHEVNVIKMVAEMLGNYIKFVNEETVELGGKILEFLIEAIQGPCRENQSLL